MAGPERGPGHKSRVSTGYPPLKAGDWEAARKRARFMGAPHCSQVLALKCRQPCDNEGEKKQTETIRDEVGKQTFPA